MEKKINKGDRNRQRKDRGLKEANKSRNQESFEEPAAERGGREGGMRRMRRKRDEEMEEEEG